MSCNPQVGDIGTLFVVAITEKDKTGTIVPVDVSAATTLEICLQSLSTTKVFTAAFAPPPCGLGDGTDGKIAYSTLLSTDLDRSGAWKIAAKAVLPAGTFRTDYETFQVETPVCP